MGVYIRNYDMANDYLAGGRMKHKYRPISKNTYLVRVSAHAIALVLHSTAIVTYYSNKSAVVFTGGWWSVTTKAKIKEHTRLNPWGTGTYGVWAIGHTGEKTPPKVQKCRARGDKWSHTRGCKGTGQLERITRCSGPAGEEASWYNTPANHENLCVGNVVCQGESRQWPKGPDGSTNYRAEKVTVLCEHGERDEHTVSRCAHDVVPESHRGHYVNACEHGQWAGHLTGTELVQCYNCQGTGMYDYGSKPVLIEWDNGAVRIDDDGQVMDLDEIIPAPWAPGRHYDWQAAPLHMSYAVEPTYNPKATSGTHIGGALADDLEHVLPGLREFVRCPVAGCNDLESLPQPVRRQIVHLNDSHKWSREAIADWLDTLDVDLAFKVA